MTPEEVSTLLSVDGLYVLGNHSLPGSTMPVLVLSHTAQNGARIRGRAFMCQYEPENELTADAELWKQSQTFLAGGPFSIANCKELAEDQAELSAMRHAIREVRGNLLSLRDGCLRAGCQSVAECAQGMLDALHDHLEPYDLKNQLIADHE